MQAFKLKPSKEFVPEEPTMKLHGDQAKEEDNTPINKPFVKLRSTGIDRSNSNKDGKKAEQEAAAAAAAAKPLYQLKKKKPTLHSMQQHV